MRLGGRGDTNTAMGHGLLLPWRAGQSRPRQSSRPRTDPPPRLPVECACCHWPHGNGQWQLLRAFLYAVLPSFLPGWRVGTRHGPPPSPAQRRRPGAGGPRSPVQPSPIQFHSVPSRPVPFRPVQSRPVHSAYTCLGLFSCLLAAAVARPRHGTPSRSRSQKRQGRPFRTCRHRPARLGLGPWAESPPSSPTPTRNMLSNRF